MIRSTSIFAGLAYAGSLIFCAPLAAQTPSALGVWQFSAGQVLVPLDETPKWRITVGPSLSYQPKYEGSQHYAVQPGLNFEIRYKERLYLSTGEGLGYDFIRTPNIRVGAGVTYDLGREVNLSELKGLGDVHPAPQIRVYGEYVLRPNFWHTELPIILSATFLRAIGGYDGFNGDAGIYLPIAGSAAKRYFVFAGASANFADQDTMQAYYGVTPAQAARSSYRVYTPTYGFRSYNVGIDWGWFFGEHWQIGGSIGSRWLVNDAGNSPLVYNRWQLSSSISIGYQF